MKHQIDLNRQIRRFSVVMLSMFVLLMANLMFWQVIQAKSLNEDPLNRRALVAEYSVERGQILLGEPGEGQVVAARSEATEETLKFVRRYPEGERYAFVTGYSSRVFGRTLAERRFNEYLIGQSSEQFVDSVLQFVTSSDPVGASLTLTLDPASQVAAETALAGRTGSVVALEPSTGKILALTSFPRFDPNELSGSDTQVTRAAWERLNADPSKPLLNRSTDELYPPGSTFKVITAAAGLKNGLDANSPLENAITYTPPQTTRPIPNFGGGTCFGNKQPITLAESLQVSCNTTFARLGNELGTQQLTDMAEAFGFNAEESRYQLGDVPSQIPTELDPPSLAQSAIGQRDVRATPLQMATVAATVANDGRRMAPYAVDRVVDADGGIVRQFSSDEVNRPVSADEARQLQDMMVDVVSGPQGTAPAAAIPGARVGGKTGTAQRGQGLAPHAWFIGFAEQGDREIAVAVLIEGGGDAGSEATGGRVAAPIARSVMQAYLGGGT